MDDTLEDMGISALGHAVKETSSDNLAPCGDSSRLQVRPSRGDDMRLVKQDAGDRGISLEDGGKQGPVAAPDIGNGAERREVISRQDGAGGPGRALSEPCIEVLIQFGVLLPMFPLAHAKDMVERRFAGHRAVKKAAPRADPLFPTEDRQAAK